MSYRHRLVVAAALAVPFTFAFPAAALEPPPPPAPATTQAAPATTRAAGLGRFLRFVDDAKGGGRLETADLIFRNPAGVTVRLVSAVHIGERSYFEKLQQTLAATDVVLYEMVKPRGMPPPPPGMSTGSGVSDLQRMMKDLLELDFQLDVVDYTRPNFVHADLDAETFQKLQSERGESFATLFLNAMMKALAEPPPGAGAGGGGGIGEDEALNDMLKFVTQPDGLRQVKLVLARQLGAIEEQAMGLGTLEGSVILTERNKALMKVLNDTIAGGKKSIAVFYGAAHMSEIADELEKMGFEPAGTEWRMAWDLGIRSDAPSLFQHLFRALEQAQQPPAGEALER